MPARRIEEAAHLYGRGPSLLWLGLGLQRRERDGRERVREDDAIDRGAVISAGVRSVGRWAWSLIGTMLATAAIFWMLAKLQVGLIPVMLAIIVCTVLYPLKVALEKIKVPGGLAAALAADDTMTGRQAHELALAIRPGTREATWQRATSDESLSNDQLRALVRGFA